MKQDGTIPKGEATGGTLSRSIALLCVVFLSLTLACFLVVSVWLTVQQRTLAFEQAVNDVSGAAIRMFHASNAHHQMDGSKVAQGHSADTHHRETRVSSCPVSLIEKGGPNGPPLLF